MKSVNPQFAVYFAQNPCKSSYFATCFSSKSQEIVAWKTTPNQFKVNNIQRCYSTVPGWSHSSCAKIGHYSAILSTNENWWKFWRETMIKFFLPRLEAQKGFHIWKRAQPELQNSARNINTKRTLGLFLEFLNAGQRSEDFFPNIYMYTISA